MAETGDLHRFASARALVKHAGLASREQLSGTLVGPTKLTGQGRPALRLAAWRAVWGSQRANDVYAPRYQHLTTRVTNKLTPTQAQTVIAVTARVRRPPGTALVSSTAIAIAVVEVADGAAEEDHQALAGPARPWGEGSLRDDSASFIRADIEEPPAQLLRIQDERHDDPFKNFVSRVGAASACAYRLRSRPR